MMEIIAIDFDGTLCVDKFPEIGEPNWEVINRAKAVQEAGIPTILNTCREGKLLDNAVKACARWGLKFDAVNENLPAFVAETGDNPRKIAATQYWDDKAVCMGTGPDPIPTPTPTRNNIVEKSGDVLKSGADVICHQVNCKGVMGTGLALQVKKQNPKLFQEYRLVCARHGGDNLGTAYILTVDQDLWEPLEKQHFIANCFGQNAYGRDKCYTDYTALKHSLDMVRKWAIAERKSTVAIPYGIGCGAAGGDWNIVRAMIQEVFENSGLDVTIWKLVIPFSPFGHKI